MASHAEIISQIACRQIATNVLSVFDYFVGLALKGLTIDLLRLLLKF